MPECLINLKNPLNIPNFKMSIKNNQYFSDDSLKFFKNTELVNLKTESFIFLNISEREYEKKYFDLKKNEDQNLIIYIKSFEGKKNEKNENKVENIHTILENTNNNLTKEILISSSIFQNHQNYGEIKNNSIYENFDINKKKGYSSISNLNFSLEEKEKKIKIILEVFLSEFKIHKITEDISKLNSLLKIKLEKTNLDLQNNLNDIYQDILRELKF